MTSEQKRPSLRQFYVDPAIQSMKGMQGSVKETYAKVKTGRVKAKAKFPKNILDIQYEGGYQQFQRARDKKVRKVRRRRKTKLTITKVRKTRRRRTTTTKIRKFERLA